MKDYISAEERLENPLKKIIMNDFKWIAGSFILVISFIFLVVSNIGGV